MIQSGLASVEYLYSAQKVVRMALIYTTDMYSQCKAHVLHHTIAFGGSPGRLSCNCMMYAGTNQYHGRLCVLHQLFMASSFTPAKAVATCRRAGQLIWTEQHISHQVNNNHAGTTVAQILPTVLHPKILHTKLHVCHVHRRLVHKCMSDSSKAGSHMCFQHLLL